MEKENLSINQIVSENITKYRKQIGITQVELAEKLNYSDKAVSKWERGESLPDVNVLMQIADVFGVTLNDLCYKSKVHDTKVVVPNKKIKHTYITLLSFGLCWLVATVVFAFLLVCAPNLSKKWLAFIYAIPVSCIVLVVFNSKWGKSIWNALFTSGIIWGVLLSICLSFNNNMVSWLYLIGVPLQILTIIWFFFKSKIIERFRRKDKPNQN
jgi:transcriptional regulator with XRE-family HTH domain